MNKTENPSLQYIHSDFVEVKIDALELGKSIKVQDINLPGITIIDAPANAIVTVTVTRSTKQEAAAAPGK